MVYREPMSNAIPTEFPNVTAVCKANVYFDGKVVSHTVVLANGARKSIGLIYPGSYTFNTGAAETMEIIAGTCRARLAGQSDWAGHAAPSAFSVPANSSFEIAVDSGIAEYVCSFE
jgi:purine/pyrimidine-nucleoside phosphorylase